MISATKGTALIGQDTTTIIVNGGTVSSKVFCAIYAEGANSDVIVCGDGKVLSQWTGIKVRGNVVVQDNAQVISRIGAINCTGSGNEVMISGGTVRSATVAAIYSDNVTVSGGTVFSYGSTISGVNQVIYQPSNPESAFTALTGDGVVIA